MLSSWFKVSVYDQSRVVRQRGWSD